MLVYLDLTLAGSKHYEVDELPRNGPITACLETLFVCRAQVRQSSRLG